MKITYRIARSYFLFTSTVLLGFTACSSALAEGSGLKAEKGSTGAASAVAKVKEGSGSAGRTGSGSGGATQGRVAGKAASGKAVNAGAVESNGRTATLGNTGKAGAAGSSVKAGTAGGSGKAGSRETLGTAGSDEKAGLSVGSTVAGKDGTAVSAEKDGTAASAEKDGTAASAEKDGTAASAGKDGTAASAGKDETAGSAGTAGNSDNAPPAYRHREPAGLRPGQKIKIAGYAEQPQTTIVEDNSNLKPTYHRAQMRVTGSMCFACLLEFQEKLKQVFGIERAKVAKSEQVSIASYAPDLANWADAVLIYDASKLDFLDLRAFMRSSGYYPYKIVDREVDSVPPEEQKKL